MTTIKPKAMHRDQFQTFVPVTTRWHDNDAYGHVNNVVYYAYFDTAVNQWLIERQLLDVTESSVIGLVVETACQYFRSVAFPDALEVGLRVTKLGRSSVRYELAVFKCGDPLAAAQGHFVHVYVERAQQRPCEIPAPVRHALQTLCVDGA